MKQTATVNDIPVYDVDAFSARQLIVGQKRDISSLSPASLINDDCPRSQMSQFLYRNWDQSSLNHFTHILIIDGNQFLDHVVWPVPGTVAGIAATIMVHLGVLPHKAFVIFDRYDGVSAKVLECMR